MHLYFFKSASSWFSLQLIRIQMNVCRQFVKSMILRLTTFLHWLMEKPYGACLTITSAENFLVLVLTRWYTLFSVAVFSFFFMGTCIILILLCLNRILMKPEVKNQSCLRLITQMQFTALYYHRNWQHYWETFLR